MTTTLPDLYAVVGNPIAQSKSPTIHTMFAQTSAQHMVYTKLLAPLGEFAASVDAFRADTARGMPRGINITAPFKLDAFAYATERTERAHLVGAANALKFESTADGERVVADNFDGIGLVRDVVHNLGCALAGKRILVLGAGGATRGALLPLLAERPAHLVVANRSVDKAHALATLVASYGNVQASSYDALAGQTFDVVFNATSSSLQAQLPPVPAGVFAAHTLAYDLTYGKGLTPFLQLARSAGTTQLADGVGMLVEQAAEAFAWWRGVRPATQAVIAHINIPLQ